MNWQALKDFILMVFGQYQPTMTVQPILMADGTITEVPVVAQGIASLDVPWLAGVCFGMLLLVITVRILALNVTLVTNKRHKII